MLPLNHLQPITCHFFPLSRSTLLPQMIQFSVCTAHRNVRLVTMAFFVVAAIIQDGGNKKCKMDASWRKNDVTEGNRCIPVKIYDINRTKSSRTASYFAHSVQVFLCGCLYSPGLRYTWTWPAAAAAGRSALTGILCMVCRASQIIKYFLWGQGARQSEDAHRRTDPCTHTRTGKVCKGRMGSALWYCVYVYR